jgi:uncharacterized protein (DUF924 family)/predicted DNA-binding protein with PD1-like motif
MYTLPLRLHPGDDLKQCLERHARDAGWSAAQVLAGTGSLSAASIRHAGAADAQQWEAALELLSLTGTLGPDGAHLHLALADGQGRVSGGHACAGCIVRTTVELLIAVLPEHSYRRDFDPATGYRELVVRPGAAAQQVLDFWFGAPGSEAHLQTRDAWFRKSEAIDRDIRERFAHEIEAALRGDLRAWEATPQGTLALILLLDQFTRNGFRNTPRAFEGDAQALQLARRLVHQGLDRQLAPVQRWFVYMPFEHAEDIAAQDESVRLFTELAQAGPGFDSALDYAHRHRDVIARFGRFPHRNAILGRDSTPAEQEYLSQPGAGF